MILGFKTQIKGVPTGFVEKIQVGTKIHTLREDVNHRWRSGMPIEFATGVRTPQYRQFKQGVCTALQMVEIRVGVGNYPARHYEACITVDGRDLTKEETNDFVKNDGFASTEEFFNWFSPVCGPENFARLRLIHWTDKRY